MISCRDDDEGCSRPDSCDTVNSIFMLNEQDSSSLSDSKNQPSSSLYLTDSSQNITSFNYSYQSSFYLDVGKKSTEDYSRPKSGNSSLDFLDIVGNDEEDQVVDSANHLNDLIPPNLVNFYNSDKYSSTCQDQSHVLMAATMLANQLQVAANQSYSNYVPASAKKPVFDGFDPDQNYWTQNQLLRNFATTSQQQV
ncbi:hypothetical protein Ciccas_013858 [Cichlidogyrus casuarinus]|uniref:Uncharacterized protein n=1 Tax=Cichlidogyrus casuarinus TaxID=1844966 RepID=A0ABD2PK20_9PLAT